MLPIAMNTLNALTIHIYKYFICGSRGAVKSTTNYLPRTVADNWMAYLPVSLPSRAQTYLVPSLVMFVCVGGGAL